MRRRRLPTLVAPGDLSEAYRQAFGTEAGQQTLNDLRKRFGRRRSFAADPYTTAFHEGQRDVYLLVMSMIDKNLDDPEETT